MFQVLDETVDAAADIVKAEPELPNFTKVCSLTLQEIGLPPRMFTAGEQGASLNILSKCKIFL